MSTDTSALPMSDPLVRFTGCQELAASRAGNRARRRRGSHSFTLNKLECSKQPACTGLNNLAWDNGIGCRLISLVSEPDRMIKRDSWGFSYSIVRGEILGFVEDELLREHQPRMFSLIKNES